MRNAAVQGKGVGDPMGRFEAKTTTEDGRVIVTLAGECDRDVRDEMASVLQTAVRSSRPVYVDVAGLTFLDSSGVHGLVTAHHEALDLGGRLYVINARGMVATVLDLTGIGALLRPSADGGQPLPG